MLHAQNGSSSLHECETEHIGIALVGRLVYNKP